MTDFSSMRENPFKVEYKGWPMTVTVREVADGQYVATVRVGPTGTDADVLLRTPDDEPFDDPEVAGTYAAQMGRQHIDAAQAKIGTVDAAEDADRRKTQLRWVNTYVKAYFEAAGGAADHDAVYEDAYRLWRAYASRDPVELARAERVRHEEEFSMRSKVPADPKRFEY